jgi:hypothetical protein
MSTMSTGPTNTETTLCQGELREISNVLGRYEALDSEGVNNALRYHNEIKSKMEKIGAQLVIAPKPPESNNVEEMNKETLKLSAKCMDRAIELCAAAFRAASTRAKFHEALQAEFKEAVKKIRQQQDFEPKSCVADDPFWRRKLGIL